MKKTTLELKSEEYNLEITEDTEVNAVFVGRNNDEIKTKINIIHRKPNITSRINIKAVVFDKARFDMEGVLIIEKGATGTDTYLKIDCLVIGEEAFARAVPSLEIKESEVKGGHGATIGYIDPIQMNYIQSHGLNKEESEKTLVEAFLEIN